MATTYKPKFLQNFKRPSSDAQLSAPTPPAKKVNVAPPPSVDQEERPPVQRPSSRRVEPSIVRFPKVKRDPQRFARRNDGLDDATINELLTRSVALVLEAVGFEDAEVVAVEEFREDVEAYITRFLASVRQSMLACRRVQAQPEDFLQALHNHSLSLRSLLPHAEHSIPLHKALFKLKAEAGTDNAVRPLPSLQSFAPSIAEEESMKYIPQHLPGLPSQHTYRTTSTFSQRQYDQMMIREKATDQGRFGEEALRRLVGTASARPEGAIQKPYRKRSHLERQEDRWRQAMQALEKDAKPPDGDEGGSFSQSTGTKDHDQVAWSGHLGEAVNAEKKYWRTAAR